MIIKSMKEQMELFGKREASASEDEMKQLAAVLETENRWMLAAELCQRLSWTKRKVRAAASASDGRCCVLSGPSSHGYKLLKHATQEEVEATCGALHHQINEQMKRLTRITRNYHNLFGRENNGTETHEG